LRSLDRLQPLALLVARVALGVVMVGHGYQNVLGHLHDHAHMLSSLGLPARLGYLSSLAELIGGLLVLAGFFTRAVAFAACAGLAVALWKMHWHNGLIGSADSPGIEFPLSLAALAFVLIFFGAGPIALDHGLRGGGSVSKK